MPISANGRRHDSGAHRRSVYDAFSEDTLDELLISRRRELRALLRAHMIDGDGEFSLEQMIDAGRVTTLAGDSIDITPRGDGMARLDDQAETVCADYLVANARIHVIDGVLMLPAPTGGPLVGLSACRNSGPESTPLPTAAPLVHTPPKVRALPLGIPRADTCAGRRLTPRRPERRGGAGSGLAQVAIGTR
jgi:hypothetical protein